MSNIEKFNTAKEIITNVELDFKRIAQVTGAVNYEREQAFAIQALKNNDFLCSIAYQNKDSLKMAIINVAAIGLTLSPIKKLAYLVPRSGKVHLDISYQGMLQMAIDIGAIKWAKAELVYKKDKFKHTGVNTKPEHEFDPFAERGELVGAYCVAKTHDNEYLTTTMPISDIFNIRDRSSAWKSYKQNGKSCPWLSDEGEMIKKTVIRRAYKSWAMTDTRKQRFEKVIEITNDDHEIDFKAESEVKEIKEKDTNKIDQIKEQLKILGRSEQQSIEYLSRTCQRKIESFEELIPSEIDKFQIMLNDFIEKKKQKEQAENENAKTSK